MFIAKLLFKLFGFTILHLGATITDGGKSERSSEVNIMMQMTVNGKYQVMSSTEAEQDGVGQSGMEILRNERFDNKIGTTLASARALCLDLLLRVWLHISGGLNCCQDFSERSGID